jgi:hypothetical protein
MTATMADSIYAANLPPGYDAYAGYDDGHWPDATAIAAKEGGKPVLDIAVFATDNGHCLDIENGDATPAQAAGWTARQHSRGIARPWEYASISVMPAVVSALSAGGIARSSVVLWSAHYGLPAHICGPTALNGKPCYPGAVQCDATQHTSSAPGAGGSKIDVSLLSGLGLFGPTASPAPPPAGGLPQYANGSRVLSYNPKTPTTFMTGTDVLYLQQFLLPYGTLASQFCDGKYGPKTAYRVSWYEQFEHLPSVERPFGVAGRQVWGRILGH